jgi:asparagine synthase (glutamine-hydrolysing)
MCGISGFIDFNQNSSKEVLIKMTDTLFHRGPDGAGYEFFQTDLCQVGLGHRRLAIIDLTETGKQPMNFEHLWITFNGEIYNYDEIKSELAALGHQFIGHSDTEMLLHAYAQWGEKCLDKFIGFFAFVLFDNKNNEIFCARDRAGIKPFTYYWKDGLFLFASELKAFHQHHNFDKKLNINSVAAFMQYGNIPTPHCIFENCTKLKPGHSLKLSFKTKQISTAQYWNVYDAYNKPKLNISFSEAKQETEKVLKKAFDYRMVADVPVGVFLSGGYDSACVTALLQKDRTEKLKTFTIGVPDIGLNEAPYAKDVANHLGTDHHEYYCTEKEALDFIGELPYYYDEPFADSSAIPTTLVCKIARKDVTVALSADAGDEIFAGYHRYDYLMNYGAKLNRIPSPIRSIGAGLMGMISPEFIPILKNKYNFSNRYDKLKGLLKNPSPKQMMLSLSRLYDDHQIAEILKQSFQLLDTAYQNEELKSNFHTPLAYMMAVDYQTYLVDDILQKVDRASMTVSLEGREPFLDHHVIEWAAQLPDNFKYHNGIKKYMLKEIVHDYIPKSLMDRPKMGFAIPLQDWLSRDLKEQVLYFLDDNKIENQGIFNLHFTQKLKKDFFAGKKEFTNKIWYLLMFQMWYERWMGD